MTRELLRKTPDVFALIILAEIFALGQLNYRVLEAMRFLRKSLIVILPSLDPVRYEKVAFPLIHVD